MIRVLLALVALVAMAWCAVLLRDSLLIDRVASVGVQPRVTPSQVDAAASWVRQARFLNPDRSVPVSWEAELDLLRGRTTAALHTYERLVAAEPQLADAWFLIAARAASADPRLAAQARAQLKKLDPLYPR